MQRYLVNKTLSWLHTLEVCNKQLRFNKVKLFETYYINQANWISWEHDQYLVLTD